MILFPKNLTVLRPNKTFVKGQVQVGTPINVPFIGNIQPLSNHDLVQLQIGRQGVGKVRVFSDRALQEGQAGPTGPLDGDRVTWGGQQYEIIQENLHAVGLIPHYAYIAELRE